MVPLKDLVHIEDPQFYLDDPWPIFERMQSEDPFFYYESLDTFVLTRYEHIRSVAQMPNVFVNSKGLFLNDVKYRAEAGGENITDTFFPKGGEQVGTTDPPRQQELRRVIAPAFSLRALERMIANVTDYAKELADSIVPGETVDWIPLASRVPIRAGSMLIGLPDSDYDRVASWSDDLEKLGGDITFEELQDAAKEFASLQEYIIENIKLKEENPGEEDMLTVLLDAELDNDKVSQANVVMFAMTMLAAGSDTTRALLSGLIHELALNPDQWTKLREDRSKVPLAIEETLRWITPARAFLRTATEDVILDGQEIKEGQHLYLMYMAANRDPRMFEGGDVYDVERPNAAKHLTFGAGVHVCAGSRLVRLEAPQVINALLDRFSSVELVGDATRVSHVIRNGWSSMPVVFRE